MPNHSFEFKPMSREQILAAIRRYAKKLGRAPSLRELKRAAKITERDIRVSFATYARALEACGMERRGSGHRVPIQDLFADWAATARKLGKHPTVAEYQMHSRYSIQPLYTRFGSWKQAAQGLCQFAQEQGLANEWQDVLEPARVREEQEPGPKANIVGATVFQDRPLYGASLAAAPLAHGPTNEAGVLYVFGMVAARLGFVVQRIQTEFPDCEAMRRVREDSWQRVRIEFEFESRNFLKHLHRAEDCDLIVCWSHNWPDCPLEVVELRKVMGWQRETHDCWPV
jgi:hypothetical protein